MASEQEIKAKVDGYIRKHRLNELFEDLCSAICYEQPKNLNQFLIEQLKIKKQTGFKQGVFKKDELKDIFALFDVQKTGILGHSACKQALKTLASSEFQWSETDVANLPERIDLKAFSMLCDEYFFSFKADKHKIKSEQYHINDSNIDKVCEDIFKENLLDKNEQIDYKSVCVMIKQLLCKGGFNNVSDEYLQISADELGIDNNTKLSFKDVRLFLQYNLKKLE